jgi:VanZ family protein
MSVLPMNSDVITSSDKINHAIGFAVYFMLYRLAFDRYTYFLIFITGCIVGVLIEFFQSFFPYRDASVYDLFADIVGLFIGFVIIFSWDKFGKRYML